MYADVFTGYFWADGHAHPATLLPAKAFLCWLNTLGNEKKETTVPKNAWGNGVTDLQA